MPVADPEPGGALGEALDERVVERAGHVDPLDPGADLPAVRKRPPQRALDCAVEIGVLEDEHRILAPELQRDRAQPLGRADCDPRAGGRRAGEHDGVDPVVADEGLADRGTWTLNDADEARRRPRLAKQTLDHASDERCQLRRLQDDAVAGGDRRRSLADRETDREVPRSDDRHDPERLVTDRTALVQQDGLAERQASRRERRLTRAGEPFERLDGDEQVVGVRLHQWLARLVDDRVRQREVVGDDRAGDPAQHGCTLGVGRPRPALLGGAGLGHGLGDLDGLRHRDLCRARAASPGRPG